MSRDTGVGRSYGVNPYNGLDDSDTPVTSLFRGDYDRRLPARSRVLAVDLEGEIIAYPFS